MRQAVIRRLIKEDIHKRVNAGLQTLAIELLDVARQLSSGTVDSSREGHPYARAHPNPAFDPRLINVGFERHSGKRFADSWELLPPSRGPGIRNTSDVGAFLEKGTKRMVKRDIGDLIRAQADKIFARHLDQALRSAAPDGTFSITKLAA